MIYNNLKYKTINYNQIIKKNIFKTYFIILIFYFMLICTGLIIDLIFNFNILYNQYNNFSIKDYINLLLTYKFIPKITIFLIICNILWIIISLNFYPKIMLLGNKYTEINNNSRNKEERNIYNIVEEVKISSGIKYTPKIYLIHENYINAFASGYSKKNSMIAITKDLYNYLNRDELQAVISHEISHIIHQDTKLKLIINILSSMFYIIYDYILIYSYNKYINSKNNDNHNYANIIFLLFFILTYILKIFLPLIILLFSLFMSRSQEYAADANAVKLMKTNKFLAQALIKIHYKHNDENNNHVNKHYYQNRYEYLRESSYIYQINKKSKLFIHNLFNTHPSLVERLKSIGIKIKDIHK